MTARLVKIYEDENQEVWEEKGIEGVEEEEVSVVRNRAPDPCARAATSAEASRDPPEQQAAKSSCSTRSAPTNALARWVGTCNNPKEGDVPTKWLQPLTKGLGWQFERGENGTLHIQAAFWLSSPMRRSALSALNSRWHFEPMKAKWHQAVAYSTKAETRVKSPFDGTDGPYTHGSVEALKDGQGSRNDLNEIRAVVDGGGTLLECFEKQFGTMVRSFKGVDKYKSLLDQRKGHAGRDGTCALEIHGFYGPPGTGKTMRMIREANAKASEYGQEPYWLSASAGNGTVWWDGYDNHRVLCIDEMTPGTFRLEEACRVFQPVPFRVQTKGGTAQLAVTSIWFTTNINPKDWYAGCENHGAWLRRINDKIELMDKPWTPPEEAVASASSLDEEAVDVLLGRSCRKRVRFDSDDEQGEHYESEFAREADQTRAWAEREKLLLRESQAPDEEDDAMASQFEQDLAPMVIREPPQAVSAVMKKIQEQIQLEMYGEWDGSVRRTLDG